jgi:hypothetical protein
MLRRATSAAWRRGSGEVSAVAVVRWGSSSGFGEDVMMARRGRAGW